MSHLTKMQLAVIAPDYVSDVNTAKQINDFKLKDINGRIIWLSQFSSVDILIINIWSAGCPVCRTEIPSITELDKRLAHNSRIALVTIAVADSFDDVAAYFPKGTNLRILFDAKNRVGEGIFKTTKYPETFILDKQRRIRARFDGSRQWHSDAFLTYLNSFL